MRNFLISLSLLLISFNLNAASISIKSNHTVSVDKNGRFSLSVDNLSPNYSLGFGELHRGYELSIHGTYTHYFGGLDGAGSTSHSVSMKSGSKKYYYFQNGECTTTAYVKFYYELLWEVHSVNSNACIIKVNDSHPPTVYAKNGEFKLGSDGRIKNGPIVKATDNLSIDTYIKKRVIVEGKSSDLRMNDDNIDFNISDAKVYDLESGKPYVRVKFEAEDGHGNVTTSDWVNYEIKDNIAPVVETRNYTVELGPDNTASIIVNNVLQKSIDNLKVKSRSVNKSSFNQNDIGSNQVLVTVEDYSGNTTKKYATVTVLKQEAPTISAKSFSFTNPFTVTISRILDDASDNSGTVHKYLWVEYSSGWRKIEKSGWSNSRHTNVDCSNPKRKYKLQGVDEAGNSAFSNVVECEYIDTEKPIINTNLNQVFYTNDTNRYYERIQPEKIYDGRKYNHYIDNTVSSGNEITSIKVKGLVQVNSFDSQTLVIRLNGYYVGSQEFERGYTSIDLDVPLSVLDRYRRARNTLEFECKTGYIYLREIGLDIVNFQNSCETYLNVLTPNSYDNCGVKYFYNYRTGTKYASGNYSIGKHNIQWRAIDNSNNSTDTTQIVELIDNTSPVIKIGKTSFYLDDDGKLSLSYMQIAPETFDNCELESVTVTPAEFSCEDIGYQTVTITATDIYGNESSLNGRIRILDRQDPILALKELDLELDSNFYAKIDFSMIDDGSYDNCGIESVELSDSTFDCKDVGSNTITVTMTDVNRNTSVGYAVVNVSAPEDNDPPVIVSKTTTLYLDENGSSTLTWNDIDDGSYDNCEISSRKLSRTIYGKNRIGDNYVKYTLRDNSGNKSSEMVLVTVADTLKPIVNVNNITLYLNKNGNAELKFKHVDTNTTDNHRISEKWLSQTEFTCDDIGDNTITAYAKDPSGNQGESDLIVTIKDDRAPVIKARGIKINLDSNGTASIDFDDLDNGTWDNCGISEITLSKSNFSCDDIGDNSVTITVTDNNSNSSKKEVNIKVRDRIDPTITARGTITYLDENAKASINLDGLNYEADDNCSIEETWLSKTSFSSNKNTTKYVKLYTKDISGNRANTLVKVDIKDTISPIVQTNDIYLTINPRRTYKVTAKQADNGSSDNCKISVRSIGKTSYTKDDVGTNYDTLTVVDNSGNETKKAFKVIVSLRASKEIFDSFEEDQLDLKITPNPVVTEAKVKFTLDETQEVNLVMYDLRGNEIGIIYSGELSKGLHSFKLPDVNNLSSGTYIISLQLSDQRMDKMIFITK